MKKKNIGLILLLFTSNILWGQDTSFTVIGVIIDEQTGEAIERASISVNQSSQGTYTDDKGYFEIQLAALPAQLMFSYLGYETQTISITDTGSKELIVQLKVSSVLLPEIAVTSRRKIDTVFQESYSIVDYHFLEDYLVLLAFKNSFEKYSLIILNEAEEKVTELSLLDKRPTTLYRACDKNLYLLTDFFAYQINVKEQQIQLDRKEKIHTFEDQMYPCILSTNNFLYFEKYFFQGQALRYLSQSKNEIDSAQQQALCFIQDERNIDLLAEDAGIRLPWSGDVWQENVSDDFAMLRTAKYNLGGIYKIFYPKIYVPLVAYDSLLCIFNHVESILVFMNQSGEIKKIIPVDYHQQKKWKKKIFYDEIEYRAYTSFNTRWGEEIRKINMTNGSLGPAIPIERAFIENPKAWNGYLYFLYRNAAVGDRNRKLHKILVD